MTNHMSPRGYTSEARIRRIHEAGIAPKRKPAYTKEEANALERHYLSKAKEVNVQDNQKPKQFREIPIEDKTNTAFERVARLLKKDEWKTVSYLVEVTGLHPSSIYHAVKRLADTGRAEKVIKQVPGCGPHITMALWRLTGEGKADG